MKSKMRTVSPVRPLAGYVGGKKVLARHVIAAIEREPHDRYAEAFVGMGGIFLRRRSAAKVEVINDRSRDVATFFRVLQRHYQALMDMLKWQVTSRAEFERLAGQDPERLTDLERSVRFLYLQRLAFGGKVAGRSFGIDTNGPARFDITKLGAMLEAAHERLAGVWIECLPWQEFLKRWDRPGTLFYLDPPYYGSEHHYGRGMFERAEFEALNEALKGLQGRFVMTLNDVPEVRRIFGWAKMRGVPVTYTLPGMAGRQAAKELIITGKRG
ncbi:MAG: DNA adenine methylase [Rhizobiales bacterium]|nr:DNA adenine methylase [Hyphomicrobiales bacterium]